MSINICGTVCHYNKAVWMDIRHLDSWGNIDSSDFSVSSYSRKEIKKCMLDFATGIISHMRDIVFGC